MQRTPVSSTAIQSIGYDPAGLILEIEFTTARVYQYRGVPPATYAGLMGAAHKGHTSTPGSRGTIRNRRSRSEGPLGETKEWAGGVKRAGEVRPSF